MPMVSARDFCGEGKFTRDGGGAQTFQERVNTLEELHTFLDKCFGTKQRIDLAYFKHITEHVTSDMVLAVLSEFRERLPCSENFWRYKHTYQTYMNKKAAQ